MRSSIAVQAMYNRLPHEVPPLPSTAESATGQQKPDWPVAERAKWSQTAVRKTLMGHDRSGRTIKRGHSVDHFLTMPQRVCSG